MRAERNLKKVLAVKRMIADLFYLYGAAQEIIPVTEGLHDLLHEALGVRAVPLWDILKMPDAEFLDRHYPGWRLQYQPWAKGP